jgi:hypothetical protein
VRLDYERAETFPQAIVSVCVAARFCSVPDTVPLDAVTEDWRYIYKIVAAIYLLFLDRIQVR